MYRCFLPRNHSYRKNKKSFIRGHAEKDSPPPRLSGEETFERVKFLQKLKKTIKNKSNVEGSICQAYIANEINFFVQHYFEPHGRPRARWLKDKELHVAHTYVLRNCPEVQQYYDLFVNYLARDGCTSDEIDAAVDANFAIWYKQFVEHGDNGITDPLLRSLAWYPSKKATSWPGCYINGYNFHTVVHGISKSTMNSGVCVRGSDSSFDFYGQLQDVVEIEYLGGGEKKAVILLIVNAQQAIQVYYSKYPSLKKDKVDWMAVCETKSWRVIDSTFNENDEVDEALQADEINQAPTVIITEQGPQLFDPNGINLTVDIGDLSEMHVPPVDSEEEYEDASSTENEDEDDEESD
ncbi:hypothetical protein COLO4_16857 [Corchorus olitorius]|uniref:DUF4216 domain-containing protein n=1 Tax=Corchorus olitorius TaxID=93759 RepID=A0A1R3JF22_9ROSI|nr:hypothetical protein COLO4_16857 [Corchorus olitorius]